MKRGGLACAKNDPAQCIDPAAGVAWKMKVSNEGKGAVVIPAKTRTKKTAPPLMTPLGMFGIAKTLMKKGKKNDDEQGSG